MKDAVISSCNEFYAAVERMQNMNMTPKVKYEKRNIAKNNKLSQFNCIIILSSLS